MSEHKKAKKTAEAEEDFSIKPEKGLPSIDTSSWPLLLKVTHSFLIHTRFKRVTICVLCSSHWVGGGRHWHSLLVEVGGGFVRVKKYFDCVDQTKWNFKILWPFQVLSETLKHALTFALSLFLFD